MAIWHDPNLSIDQLQRLAENTLGGYLGMEFTEIGEDYLTCRMPVDHRTRQPYGLLHGGASVVLAETLGSTGAVMCVDKAGFLCVGQEINANHVRSARSGQVTGTARPVHLGGRSHVWAIEIVNGEQALVFISRMTVAIIKVGALK